MRKYLAVITTIVLLVAVFLKTGIQDVLQSISIFETWAVLSILGLFSINIIVVSYRLGKLLSHFNINLPFRVISKASIAGHVAGLFFMSLIGQTVGRNLILGNYGLSPVLIASLMAYERAIIFLVGTLLCILGSIVLVDKLVILDFISGLSLIDMIIAIVLSLSLSVLIGRSKYETKIISNSISKKNITKLFSISVITLAGQGLVISSFVVGVYSIMPDIDLWSLLAASAIISFAASIPVSLNGWGVRELAAVYTLGYLGVSSSDALAVSILIGLCSTAIILAFSPAVFYEKNKPGNGKLFFEQKLIRNKLDIDKAVVWIISITTAALVFFQAHVKLSDGVINLNLADPFALLSIVAIAMNYVMYRKLPTWRIKEFNYILLSISILLAFSFLHGITEIGVTQWALVSRLTGWLIILGYIAAGYLVVATMGEYGLQRFLETIVITAIVVVIIRVIVRYTGYYSWIELFNIPKNFEGYSGNRNAFAFQLLTSSIIMLAYSKIYLNTWKLDNNQFSKKKKIKIPGKNEAKKLLIYAVLHGIILAGVIFTGSRAGIITGIILLIIAYVMKLSDRKIIITSIIISFVFVSLIIIAPIIISETGNQAQIFGRVSTDNSNIERWETIVKGISLWWESPIMGAGLGVFIERSKEWFSEPLVIHSTPIWILAEFGLVGIALFIWVLMVFILYLYKSKVEHQRNKILLMLLFVFVLFGMVHDIFYQRIFWLVLGAVVALNHNYKQEYEDVRKIYE